MSILGSRVTRTEDRRLLIGEATFVDSLTLEGAAHVTFVRSTMAHARITALDVDDARAAPGVVAVVTAADVDLEPVAFFVPMVSQEMKRPFLADDVVRFVGEPVVAVVTEERYQGPDAAELVFVDYEPLPAVVDPEDAARDEVLLFPDVGSNVAMELDFGHSGDALFAGCEAVVSQRVVNTRVAPCPLEVRSVAARWDGGRLTYWSSNQSAHSARDQLVRLFDLEPGDVRAITPDVGGGFGAKMHPYTDELLVAWLARRVGRPLKWVETRSESMVSMGHGRAQVQLVEIGGRRDGTVEAFRLTVLQDAGAYPLLGAFLPYMTRLMLTGVYAIPKGEFNAKSVLTNTTPVVAYRGAGRPEATAAIERAMDLWAVELGLDPADVRRRNLVAKDAFPYTTPVQTIYDSGDYGRALDLALAEAGYDDLRDKQRRRRFSGDARQLGIGLSVYVEITAGPSPGDSEHGAVEVRPDGTAVVRTGTSPHGQGHDTSWAMLVSDATGIALDDVEVAHGDTDEVPDGVGTWASRSLQIGGMAVHQATEQVVARARALAAEMCRANPDDIVLDKGEGRFHVAGTPDRGCTWSQLAGAAADMPDLGGLVAPGGGLSATVQFASSSPTFPFGCHVAVVEVDTETGGVRLQRLVAVDDAGCIINPVVAEGQIHGGLAQGVAQALLEEMVYDADGNPLTSNFADYGFVTAAELPTFELVSMETPTPANPLGVKGIGESGTVGSTPAVQNAVIDALSHLGVRHIDMPLTAERVWRAICEASA